MSNDLPFSLRQCTRKLKFLLNLNLMTFDAIRNHKIIHKNTVKNFKIINLQIGILVMLFLQFNNHIIN